MSLMSLLTLVLLSSVSAADAIRVGEGDTPGGQLESWTANSSLRELKFVASTSRHEQIAIFYDATRWSVTSTTNGSFSPGRPWLLSSFAPTKPSAVAEPLWVMAVHLPHFLDTDVDIGTVAASALRSAGVNATAALLVLGDFNEFEWEDNPCWTPYYPADCRAQAKKRMAALWDTFLQGAATDVVTKHAITCCTKWSVGDRFTTNYTEWSFEYDHIFATSKLVASGAHLIPYTYPGTAKRCVDAACTGEDPPANVTALHQGSWHRGWVVDFSWVGLE